MLVQLSIRTMCVGGPDVVACGQRRDLMQSVLVTGAAGFIGAALCQRLLQRGDRVIGLDNLNDYYDPRLKQERLRQIEAVAPPEAWRFEALALEDADRLHALFASERPQVVVNLAAQAGVRYSWRTRGLRPQSWVFHLLEAAAIGTEHLVYASVVRSTGNAICPSMSSSL